MQTLNERDDESRDKIIADAEDMDYDDKMDGFQLSSEAKEDMACEDMADVCELAHKRTVAECAIKGIQVDASKDCEHYTPEAQTIFDKHYDAIIENTGL